MDDQLKKPEEDYLTAGKVFTAVRDLPDYDIDEGDKVKIDSQASMGSGTTGYFELINMQTQKHFRIYSLEFIKHFK